MTQISPTPRRSAFHSRVMLSADPVTNICRLRCIERAVTRPDAPHGTTGRRRWDDALQRMIERAKTEGFWFYLWFYQWLYLWFYINMGLPCFTCAFASYKIPKFDFNGKNMKSAIKIPAKKNVVCQNLSLANWGSPFFRPKPQWQSLATAWAWNIPSFQLEMLHLISWGIIEEKHGKQLVPKTGGIL